MGSQKSFSYIIVYLLLLFKAGFFFVEFFNRYTSFLLFGLVVIFFIYFKKNINRTAALLSFVTLFLEFITYIIKGFPGVGNILSNIVNILLACFIVSSINKDSFKRIFSNIIFIICIESLLCFLLYTLGFPLYQKLPLLINSQNDGGYFALFSIPRMEFGMWSNYRIQGIFWEPGAFQFFIIVSAIIDLYDKHILKKNLIFRFLIYAITIFFTFSTTGILCGFILIILFLLKQKNKVYLLAFMFFAFCLLSYGVIDQDSFLYYTVIDKIINVGDMYEYGSGNDVSAEVRLNSFTYVLDEFIRSPIVGMGPSGKDNLKELGITMMTFTPLNYFAFYGLLMGIIHVYGLIKVMRLRHKRRIEAVIVLFVLVLSTVSEQFAFNPILMCFSFYGYNEYSSRQPYKHIANFESLN